MSLFATCSYPEFTPGMGVPVRSSNGHPKYKLRFTLEYALRETFPRWNDMRKAYPDFRARYIEQLDRIGTARIRDQAREIHTAYTRRYALSHELPVVLLCFENLTKPNQWCHRSVFASWWVERTGEPVPELGAHEPAPPEPDPQESLF